MRFLTQLLGLDSYGLDGLLASFNALCRRANRKFNKLKEARFRLQDLEQAYPEWLGIHEIKRPYFVLGFVASVMGLDVFFFGTASAWMAGSLSEYEWLGLFAPFIVPAFILGLDLGLGVKIHSSKARTWLVMGLLLVLAIVFLSAASQVAVLLTSGVPGEVSGFLFLGLLLLVTIAHGTVVFMGESLEDTMKYFVVVHMHKHAQSRVEELEEELEEVEEQALKKLTQYLSKLKSGNNGHEIQPGPFAVWAQHLVDKAYPGIYTRHNHNTYHH